MQTNLKPLQQNYPFENWYSVQPIHHGLYKKLSYTYNDVVLFGHAFLDHQCIAENLRETYENIVQLLNSENYALLRVWHYLPQLCEPTDYQMFCDARAQAFSTFKSTFYCAATVIGNDSEHGVIYFIATHKAGIPIDNPRQTLPHLYPKHYVKPAPMFARATLKQWGKNNHLYISGTAAIVGHKSLHEGDADAQLNEIVRNINTLLKEATETEQNYRDIRFEQLQYIKIYTDRRVSDHIVPLIDKHLGNLSRLQIFEGQLCRPDLLVEAEAIAVCDCTDDNYA